MRWRAHQRRKASYLASPSSIGFSQGILLDQGGSSSSMQAKAAWILLMVAMLRPAEGWFAPHVQLPAALGVPRMSRCRLGRSSHRFGHGRASFLNRVMASAEGAAWDSSRAGVASGRCGLAKLRELEFLLKSSVRSTASHLPYTHPAKPMLRPPLSKGEGP